MRQHSKIQAAAAVVAVVGLLATTPDVAMAAWPPPLDATSDELREADAWPDDPLYGYSAAIDAGDRRDGQWELYSFIPDRSPGIEGSLSGEVASGVSIDLAWRQGIGSPGVVLAIASTGIDWSERDLFEQVELNRGELRGAPPLRPDSPSCDPLSPIQPSVDLFDCNGDGRFTLADYALHPDLEPADTEPPGDTNGNGWFDPQDLLRQPFVADAIDSDQNGYIDDILGWDFVDNDNDPFDENGSGFGTREALAAAADTNNGIGRAGACPRCRVLPLRVAHSGLVESHSLAVATVYAVGRGARVLAITGETGGISSLLHEAFDYASRSGTLLLAESGSDATRRPAFPSADRLVLGVGGVTLGGVDASSTTASTFLAASPCSGFGPQRQLSVPTGTCPTSVVGLAAGAAGLAISWGIASDGSRPRLTSDELAQLLTTTADDVDVIESREEASTLAWSQPGFDQHFGYGRLNADRVMERLASGALPPSVQIERPTPLTTLYADQLTGPVPITGTVTANQAKVTNDQRDEPSLKYDYVVDWAPGIQPSDSSFEVITEQRGVSVDVVAGETSPLAMLDVRSLELSENPAGDDELATLETTITVRVRATVHYEEPNEDVSGEARRSISVQRDARTVKGFPVQLGSSSIGGPKLADIDGDGVRDVVVTTTDGEIQVWSLAAGEPELVGGFPPLPIPLELPAATGFSSTGGVDPVLARESFAGPAAIGDLDGDGDLEIVATTTAATVVVVDNRGQSFPGWPQALPTLPDCEPGSADTNCLDPTTVRRRGIIASPVLEDLDGDGDLEIIQAGIDGQIHVFSANGDRQEGWPVRLGTEDDLGIPLLGTPALVDLNGDERADLVVPTSLGGGTSSYVAIDSHGELVDSPILSGWPVDVVDWPLGAAVTGSTPGSPAAGDFSGDQKAEVVFHGNVSVPFIVAASPGRQESPELPPEGSWPVRDPGTGARGIEYTGRFGAQSTANPSQPMFPMLSAPSLGDLDQDGTPDIVTLGASRDVAEQRATGLEILGPDEYLLAFWSGATGSMFPGSPAVVAGSPWYGDAAIADISGDGYPEIITGTDGLRVHAVDACGRSPEGWPKTIGQWAAGSPAVGDIDGDDTLEVVVASRTGWLFAWHTNGSRAGTIAWASQHHDNRNTGSLTTDLGQGSPLSADRPLFISVGGKCLAPGEEEEEEPHLQLSPSGGCGCHIAKDRPRAPLAWLLAVGAVMVWLRRQRRRTVPRMRARGSRPRRCVFFVAKVGLEPTTPRL